ncbi:recombinase family protein [Longitalea luteola]|uniref:recombinase family protein n=1 Tax=Longitalea luteola TaxID=2812563 RepID=UPI001A9662B8|nr:recombinase family protein [Longitalea luteola]
MSITLDLFAQWAKRPDNIIAKDRERIAVVYTRVSTKEQYENNLSLDFQRATIEDYAKRHNFKTIEYFGGTFESAQTDGRKEFQRMLTFVKKNKKVTHILVYLLDRFSRTGGEAIKVAKDLREKYGVSILAVTQPIDTSNPGGVFQQNMQLLFSEYDNMLRRQRAMAGIKEKLERGIWCIKPPMGYTVIKENGVRKIVVDETGKKLRKAFQWKAQGMKNEAILEKLRAMGVLIYKQKLSQIFSNPFYCGIISNQMLEGKLVEGTHEKLITYELFLQVNDIRKQAKGKFGTTHNQTENELIPLKAFMRCHKCGSGYTGYVVKAKNLYYYKCRTTGCKCNKRAELVNRHFEAFLSQYSIKPELVEPFLYQAYHLFDKIHGSSLEQEKSLKTNLTDVQKKIDTIEEKYYINGDMPKEAFDRFIGKLTEEKENILKNLAGTKVDMANLKKTFAKAITFSSKLTPVWASSETQQKEKLQKLIFPKGIVYLFENETFRTEQVNEVFAPIADQVKLLGD